MNSLIKYTWMQFKEFIVSARLQAKMERKYPTCLFYPGAIVDDISRLGKYNVIFQKSIIIDSVIGDHTFIQKNSQVICAEIGKFCSIAGGVKIGLGRHPLTFVSTHPAFYSATQPLAKTFCQSDVFSPFQRTSIGHDVWIGESAMIVDGIKIGIGAVVAAGAVVTKDVPPYAIVAGVPAKIIKYRFDEETKKQLLQSKWWDMDEDVLRNHYKLFMNAKTFVTTNILNNREGL